MQRNVKLIFAGLLAVSVALVLALHTLADSRLDLGAPFGAAADITGQQEGPGGEEDVLVATNCRYGVGYIPDFAESLAWIPTLDAGWFINFNAVAWGETIYSASFAPVIRIKQVQVNDIRQPEYTVSPPLTYSYRDQNGNVQDGLGALIARNPGHYWIVGNEVDVNNNVQDNTMPDLYAKAYHEIYHYIKKVDPTAKVAVAGLSMMTPGRLQYLTIVWDTYRTQYGQDMPVDIWNMHLYILEERNPDNLPSQYGDGKIALGTDPALAKLTSYRNKQYCPGPNDSTPDPRPDVYCNSEHDSLRIFQEQVQAMRQWMKERGQQNKPLIISEYGSLYAYVQDRDGTFYATDEHGHNFNPDRVARYLRDTVRFMEDAKDPNLGYPADENRLVQQWLWYSIVTDPSVTGGSSNLINWQTYTTAAPGDPAALTAIGQAFSQEATSRVGASNLVGGVASNVSGFIRQDGKASVLLTASFRNSGTLSVIQPVQVSFYSDPALTKVIGSVTYNPAARGAITGCTWGGRNSEQVAVMWSNLAPGTYNYWAKIDTGNVVTESSESDNVTTSGRVTIRTNGLFVPLVSR